MPHFIYLDNAATTRLNPDALQAMLPYLTTDYANPSSIYHFAARTKAAVEAARQTIASYIGAKEDEIFFTSGGSESDNWALKGAAQAQQKKGRHIITTAIEHHAVLHSCEYLAKQGYEITYVGVDENGIVRLDELKAAIRPSTILISVMAANNEIGSLQPVGEIGKLAHAHNILFHTDAVQAFGHEPLNVNALNVDMLSASGHKINGPKGIGFLYLRRGLRLSPFMHGGAQEKGLRAGTHNVPGIVGMAKAAELAHTAMAHTNDKISALRDHLIKRVLQEIPYSRLNGHPTKRLANNASFCFRFIEGEALLIQLDQKGICASSGSACTSGSLDPSHVLLALGLDHATAHGSLRLTLGSDTTAADIDYTVDTLKEAVARLRHMSPLYEDFLQKTAAKGAIYHV